MPRLRTLLPRFASLVLAQAVCATLDLHPGLVEEWEVRTASGLSTLTVRWLDSAIAEGGTTDWTALISRQGTAGAAPDTVVLRRFDLAALVDSGVYRPGHTSAWVRASCLMPFQREVLDSIVDTLIPYFKSGLFREPYFPVLNQLRSGAIAEFCSGNRNTLESVESMGGSGVVCFQSPGSECDDCRSVPLYRSAPGMGYVAWRSMFLKQDWRLLKFGDHRVEQRPGRLVARPSSGETWIWTRGGTTNLPLSRMTVLAEAKDAAGVPEWEVEIETQDAKGAGSRRNVPLRIDTLQGWVTLGDEVVSPWAPYASIEARLALGFYADWGSVASDTFDLVADVASTRCFGNNSSSWSHSWKVAQGVGTISIRDYTALGSFPYGSMSDVWWTLLSHTMEPVSVRRDPDASEPVTLAGLRRSFASRPDLRLRRIALDGRTESATGSGALRLLGKRGVALFVIGDGADVREVRLVVP